MTNASLKQTILPTCSFQERSSAYLKDQCMRQITATMIKRWVKTWSRGMGAGHEYRYTFFPLWIILIVNIALVTIPWYTLVRSPFV